MTATPPHNPPPGWYPSPKEPGLLRWWDGQDWTQATYTHPLMQSAFAPVVQPVVHAAPAAQPYPVVQPVVHAAPAAQPYPVAQPVVRAAPAAQPYPGEESWALGFMFRRPVTGDHYFWGAWVVVLLWLVPLSWVEVPSVLLPTEVAVRLLAAAVIVVGASAIRYAWRRSHPRRQAEPVGSYDVDPNAGLVETHGVPDDDFSWDDAARR